MTIRIGSNIASLTAQRRLGEADATLSKSFERLSSGQRINRASDDAAGLAIADDLKAKTRIYTQAIRNGNDGISLLNIADSAIEALAGIVTRIRELSEQAANGTYSNQQRSAIDAEAQALSKEYTRITQTTSFNGLKLFDGSLGSGLRLQLGIGLNESINLSIAGGGTGGIGTGTFNEKSSFITETSGISVDVTLGDLNGDGILDIITAGSNPGNLRLGNGDGTFGDRISFNNSLIGVQSVTLGDLNGDGLIDLVAAGAVWNGRLQGQASVMLGNGNGTFQNPLTIATETTVAGSATSIDVALGDLNGDGILDLVTSGLAGQGQASVLLGNGNGTFGSKITFLTENSGNGVTLGDLNGDGILDLVTTGEAWDGSRNQGQVSIMLGNGNGTFGTKITIATETSGSGNSSSFDVTLGDLNGDGILDLVTAGEIWDGSRSQGQASVLLGNGNGTFGNKITIATETSDSGDAFSKNITLGDLNSDGILDLVTSGTASNGSRYQGQSSILLGNGDGTFGSKITIATQTSGSGNAYSEGVSLGDLNGDNVLDLVTAGDVGGQGQASVMLAKTQEGLGALLSFSLKTESEALQSMGILDRTLENLAKQRGSIGASQSRINIAISNLQTAKENFSTAESRIRDTDVAAEATNLIRTQILQQAAASILSQANQAPQLALTLLR